MFTIRECKLKEDIAATHRLIHQMYPHISRKQYMEYIKEMRALDYHLIAAFDKGECLAAAGFRLGRRLYCGKFIHMENLVVDEDCRKSGIASELVDWVRNYGKRNKCNVMLADTYSQNTPAQKLFFKEGFFIRGFHFYQSLDGVTRPPKAAIVPRKSKTLGKSGIRKRR